MDLQSIIDERIIAQKAVKAAARKKAAADGHALPDGSYPIENEGQLRSAIKLNGNSKSHSQDEVRRHIRKRAKALGKTDLIPESWDQVSQSADSGFLGWLKGIYRIDREVDRAIEEDETVAQDGIGIPSTDPSALQPGNGIQTPEQPPIRRKKQKKRKRGVLLDTVTDQTVLTPKTRVTQEVPILQVDEMKRVVTGVVQTPDVEVRPASMPNKLLVYPKSTVQQMAWDFLRNYHNGSIGLRHSEVQQGQIVPQKGENATVVESYLAPIDMEFPNGRTVQQGSWIMSVQINNDSAWEDVLRGDLRAFSLASTKVKFSNL